MNDAKYMGLDVHQATISAAVLDSTGKPVMESVLETKAATLLQFIQIESPVPRKLTHPIQGVASKN